MTHGGTVYIMTNKLRTVIYVGVTADLPARIREHEHHVYKNSFTARYHCVYCIWYEHYPTIMQAIAREKEIKKWRREKKNQLIQTVNPNWENRSPLIKTW